MNGTLDMNKFKIGDRVKYIGSEFGDSKWNPLWDGKCGKIVGIVYEMHKGSMDVRIEWDNGEENSYYYHNLEFHVKPLILPDELFEI